MPERVLFRFGDTLLAGVVVDRHFEDRFSELGRERLSVDVPGRGVYTTLRKDAVQLPPPMKPEADA